jgi:hypothetical protein
MAKDHRINQGGAPLNYSCENYGYRTDIGNGQPHSSYAATRGSVTGQPLVRTSQGATLWIEHVEEVKNSTQKCYWLMWYDPDGKPTIPLSGVLDKTELGRLAQQLMQFVP